MRSFSSAARVKTPCSRSNWPNGRKPIATKSSAALALEFRGSIPMDDSKTPSTFERKLLKLLGQPILDLADSMGRVVLLIRQTFMWLRTADRKTVLEQVVAMGVES